MRTIVSSSAVAPPRGPSLRALRSSTHGETLVENGTPCCLPACICIRGPCVAVGAVNGNWPGVLSENVHARNRVPAIIMQEGTDDDYAMQTTYVHKLCAGADSVLLRLQCMHARATSTHHGAGGPSRWVRTGTCTCQCVSARGPSFFFTPSVLCTIPLVGSVVYLLALANVRRV